MRGGSLVYGALPEFAPCHQVRIDAEVPTPEGATVLGTVHMTVHRVR